MDVIPPTRAAHVQHIKGAVYQGGHCWDKALQAFPDLSTSENWGWTDPSNWKPYGQLCQKLLLQQGTGCAVVARKGAEVSASAGRQL